jgi:hypothetical protein
MHVRRVSAAWLLSACAAWVSAAGAETISGVVAVAPGGAPLAGATIQVAFAGSEAPVFSATSQANGSYVVNLPPVGGLPSNNFRLRAFAPDHFNLVHPSSYCVGPCAFALGTTVTVPVGTNVANIDFAMRVLPLATIQGTVTDAQTGGLLSGVSVRATQYVDADNNQVERSTTTAGNGTFSLAVVAGVPLRIGAFPTDGRIIEIFPEASCFPNFSCVFASTQLGNVLTLTTGQVLAGTNFTLSFPGSASGTVASTTTPGPIEGAVLEFVASDGYRGRIETAANGNYTIELPPGTYRASIAHAKSHFREQWDNLPCTFGCAPANGTPIVVNASANTPGIDFALQLGGSISGVVSPPDSTFDFASVMVFDAAGVLVDNLLEAGGSSTTSAFRTRVGLPTGSYFLRTIGNGGARAYVHQVFAGLPCDLDCNPSPIGTAVAVTSGVDTGGTSFSLGYGCQIRPTIREDVTNRALPNARVQVFNASGTLVRDSLVAPASAGFNVDPLRAVAAGQYFVKVLSAQHVDELFDGIACETGCNVTTGTPLTCTGFADTTTLSPAVSLQPIDAVFASGFE